MTNANQQDPAGNSSENEEQKNPDVPVSEYHLYSGEQKSGEEDLYSFRAMMAEAPAATGSDPSKPESAKAGKPAGSANERKKMLVFGAIAAAALLLAIIAVTAHIMHDTPPPYSDMGTSGFAAAGLGGHLITEWTDKARYRLEIDPEDAQQLAEFNASVANPPRPLTFSFRLLDASGVAYCQKQILLPIIPPQTDDSSQNPLLLPQKTSNGDIVQNLGSTGGQVSEIHIEGDISCPEKYYKRIAGWDFSTNFPTLAEQAEWLKQPKIQTVAAKQEAAKAKAAAIKLSGVRSLPTAIEGDDVITYDAPARGIVETSGGRVFYVSNNELRGNLLGWQIFPAAIHFRCSKKSACILSRAGTNNVLHATLKSSR